MNIQTWNSTEFKGDKSFFKFHDGISIQLSAKGGGCGHEWCKCAPGYWISINKIIGTQMIGPCEFNVVQGIKITFDCETDLNHFINETAIQKIKHKI